MRHRVPYIERTRAFYARQEPYRWVVHDPGLEPPPWAPIRRPLEELRIALIGSGGIYCDDQEPFPAQAAHDLFLRGRMGGFTFDVGLLMMAERGGYVVKEVAVNWTHKPGSRVNLLLDSLRMARDLLIIRGRALRGEYERPRVTPLPGGRADRSCCRGAY